MSNLDKAKQILDKELDIWEEQATNTWQKLIDKGLGQPVKITLRPIAKKSLESSETSVARRNSKKRLNIRMSPEKRSRTFLRLKGGPGSGDFGHKGRIGMVGGSAESGSEGRLTITLDVKNARKAKRIEEAIQARTNALKKGKTFKKDIVPAPKEYYDIMDEETLKAANSIIEKATNGKINDFTTFAYNAYVFEDKASGIRTELNSIGANEWTGKIRVTGNVYNVTGESIGTFERIIHADGEVHNDYFRIHSSEQGSGFGAKFYENAELTYLETGIEKETIFANIDVGGYAWARMGFDFSSGFDRQDKYEKLVSNYKTKHSISTIQLAMEALKSFGITPNSKAYDFAAFTDSDGERLGKKLLLGTAWDAVKYIDESNDGFLAGMTYYETKNK